MSVSFIVDIKVERVEVVEPCLCAQMSPLFGELLHDTGAPRPNAEWAPLCLDADPGCHTCEGTGIERVSGDARPQVNFCNANAAIIARAMGLELNEGYGAAELAVFRRGFIRARNTKQPDTLRESETGDRSYVAGYTRDELLEAVMRLEVLVLRAAALGATRLLWQ